MGNIEHVLLEIGFIDDILFLELLKHLIVVLSKFKGNKVEVVVGLVKSCLDLILLCSELNDSRIVLLKNDSEISFSQLQVLDDSFSVVDKIFFLLL